MTERFPDSPKHYAPFLERTPDIWPLLFLPVFHSVPPFIILKKNLRITSWIIPFHIVFSLGIVWTYIQASLYTLLNCFLIQHSYASNTVLEIWMTEKNMCVCVCTCVCMCVLLTEPQVNHKCQENILQSFPQIT